MHGYLPILHLSSSCHHGLRVINNATCVAEGDANDEKRDLMREDLSRIA
jgi:hypothetical protein